MTAPHMLPSTLRTVSASATCSLSRLNCPPRTIAVYASPRSSPSTTQHSLPGGRYPLPSTGWNAPASPGAHVTELPPATGGFLRDREIYSDAQGDGGLATTEPGSRKVRSAPGPSE